MRNSLNRDKRLYSATIAAILTLFFAAYLLLCMRAPRFVDEDIAIGHGWSVIRALFSIGGEIKAIASHLDGNNSIGLPVGIPAGILFRLTHDILWIRVLMGFWALLYWIGALSLLFAILDHIQFDARLSNREIALSAFITLCFVQAVPFCYLNQATALGEFPGAALLLLGFAAYVRKRAKAGALLTGMAVILKLYYLLYLPASAIVFLALTLKRPAGLKGMAKALFSWAIWYGAPVAALQLLKVLAFGPSHYIDSWKPYMNMIVGQSGVGGSRSVIENEFIHYSRRTKAYFILGTIGPTALFSILLIKGWARRHKTLFVMLMAVAICGLIGGVHWYFLAPLKWWRRAYPFVVPGYAITIIAAIVFLMERLSARKRTYQAALAAVLILALYVQVRQTIAGTIGNNPLLNDQNRHAFKDPYIERSKIGL